MSRTMQVKFIGGPLAGQTKEVAGCRNYVVDTSTDGVMGQVIYNFHPMVINDAEDKDTKIMFGIPDQLTMAEAWEILWAGYAGSR